MPFTNTLSHDSSGNSVSLPNEIKCLDKIEPGLLAANYGFLFNFKFIYLFTIPPPASSSFKLVCIVFSFDREILSPALTSDDELG